MDQVLRVERMRQAIMEGLKVDFANPILHTASLYHYPYPPFGGPNMQNMGNMGMNFPQRGGMMGRGGMRGIPAGMTQGQSQPKPPSRGRGILGNVSHHAVQIQCISLYTSITIVVFLQ